jgi:hypothetical protein
MTAEQEASRRRSQGHAAGVSFVILGSRGFRSKGQRRRQRQRGGAVGCYLIGSSGRTRTYNPSVNRSREAILCRLLRLTVECSEPCFYAGSAPIASTFSNCEMLPGVPGIFPGMDFHPGTAEPERGREHPEECFQTSR